MSRVLAAVIRPATQSAGALLGLVALVLTSLTAPAAAEEAGAEGAGILEEVVVIGTRRDPRSVGDSPVPIDVINGEDFIRNGDTDMDSLLRTLVPSYNVSRQPINDAATIVRPANLRGLPPDSTLILVNGKRRHRSAVIAFLSDGVSDGSQGPDLSVIPSIALDRVEVLRDGAAAQYGSDAIAGVMNFVLRDDTDSRVVEARYGEFYEGDGETWQVSANVGFPLTDAGFANFSLELKDAEPTSRSVQRGDAADLIASGNSNVIDPVQIWGSPKVDGDFKFFANTGLDLGNGHEVYAFGNWAERTVDGGFFFRNPNTRGGIFDGPEVLIDGVTTDTILMADFTAPFDGQSCGLASVVDDDGNRVFPIVNNIPDPAVLAALSADPNCFAFNELAPGGFTPRFGGKVVDASFSAGVKGEFESGLQYDLSATVGQSNVDYKIRNTVNPQLAALETSMPRKFKPGAYSQTERAFNLDLRYPVEVEGFASDLNVAGGLEYREEIFELEAGDPNSFFIDNEYDLPLQGFGIGSNGFPGFKPQDAGEHSRGNVAAYIDLEADITDAFLLGVAVRYEDFEDVGDTTNGKIAALWRLSDAFSLRAAASTGFRAPTVGQANVRNVTTAFTAGRLADEATLPPTNPISVQKGGKPLTEEESVNLTVGAVIDLDNLSITVDYFNIEVEDRIALTTTQLLTQDDITALLAQGVADATSFTGVRFFTNDFDTTTQGIDIVATYPLNITDGDTDLALTFNWTETEVDSFNPAIITDTRVRQLEESLPEIRWSLTATHLQGPWRGMVRVNYYDDYFEAHVDDSSLPIEGDSEFTVDLELGYQVNNNIQLIAGAQNLFDEDPDRNPWDTIVGSKFPPRSPMGINGGFWYFRAIYDFGK